MRNTREILGRAMALGLLGALLASNLAQAKPGTYSKTLTFTLSTSNPAPPPAKSGYYLPANTKYSPVKTQRAGTQVAVESLEIAHEGFRAAPQKPVRVGK